MIHNLWASFQMNSQQLVINNLKKKKKTSSKFLTI